jgi:hypothetical protein
LPAVLTVLLPCLMARLLTSFGLDLRFAHRDAVDEAELVLFGGHQRGAGAVGGRRGDHQGVGQGGSGGAFAGGVGGGVFSLST